MHLREKILSWWLERRARTSSSTDVVFNAVSVLCTLDHPNASKAIWGLLHFNETERLKAVVSAIIDNADGDPFDTLQTYNSWALKDEKFWIAVLGIDNGGQALIQTALTCKEFRNHKAAASAVQTLKERSLIPSLLTGMAQHSRAYSRQQGRQNNDCWDFKTIDNFMSKIADDWRRTGEALSAVPGLVAAFASSDPEKCQADFLVLLNVLDPDWTNLEDSRECITCLKAIAHNCTDTAIQQQAHDGLERIPF